MIRWMPVPSEDDGQLTRLPIGEVAIQRHDHLVAVRDCERAARKEVALHVGDNKRVPGPIEIQGGQCALLGGDRHGAFPPPPPQGTQRLRARGRRVAARVDD